VIINLKDYTNQLREVFKNLNKLKNNQAGLEKNDIKKVVEEWKKICAA